MNGLKKEIISHSKSVIFLLYVFGEIRSHSDGSSVGLAINVEHMGRE